jgi:single-stranded-DNA-specific exonuclease
LLVTCDCGSSDHASLARVRESGLDAIVIDHHLVPDEPLPVLAFLNPHRPECGFPYKGLASCGLALSIGAALRGALGKELDLRRWLDLVAIGTIADVAPLDGDNRALVRAGLAALSRATRPGVRALLELAKLSGAQSLTAEDVAFRIAPRLNAPGRLGAPDAAVRLLLAKTDGEAAGLAAEVEQASLERRAVQDRMLEEALTEIAERGFGEHPAIVLGREGWNHGIVGIVAGRLASQFGKPVVVAGFSGGHGRGSVRGPQGSRLFDALSACKEHVLRFGGHQAAAGVELRLDALDAFRESFEQASASAAALSAPQPEERAPCVWLAPGDALPRVLKDLYLLEPCSHSCPAPDLALEASVLSAREVTGGHLKLELDVPGSGRLGAFGVGMGERAASLSGRVVVSGKLRSDRYRGGDAVELRLERVEA